MRQALVDGFGDWFGLIYFAKDSLKGDLLVHLRNERRVLFIGDFD